MLPMLTESADGTIPLTPLTKESAHGWLDAAGDGVAAFARASGFTAAPGTVLLVPGSDGVARVLAGIEAPQTGEDDGALWALAGLPLTLPEAMYRLDPAPDLPVSPALAERFALGWALGSYRYLRYRTKAPERRPATLVWPDGVDRATVESAALATFMARDLVNTPANDLGPGELAAAAEQLAAEFEARIKIIVGDDLLLNNYPAIHTVGHGAARAPRLIDLNWRPAGTAAAEARELPRVTLIGKGVVFDTGGLDLKPASAMALMKKDMGGAAQALGLARMVMAADLPVRLRVLIPAVENSVSGTAFRPGDVMTTRRGLTVEVGNTDAEGRLVLCDALAEAADEAPALILDFATLTGAARVALGPDLPALFCNDEALARDLAEAARREDDPLWRLPLHQPYARNLKSAIADTNNISEGGMAGAITAALFLERFLGAKIPWAHFDVYAWNQSDRPGRPKGGEAMGIRACFSVLQARFGGSGQ